MPAHHLLGQKSWNLHFGLKSPRTKVKNHIGHDQKIAGPFSNTCGNWSGVHLVCFKHALLSKSGCFRHVWPWITLWDPTLLPSSTRKNLHWEKLRLWACQGTCIWWWKTFKNKGPKHIMCHHHRNAILMQTQTKIEHNFTPSVLKLCFFFVSAVSPSLAPESFFADIRLQEPSLCPISTCFLNSSWEIIPTSERLHRLIYFFEVEGLRINKKLIRGSLTVGVP